MLYCGDKDPSVTSVLNGEKCWDQLVMPVMGEGLESGGVPAALCFLR